MAANKKELEREELFEEPRKRHLFVACLGQIACFSPGNHWARMEVAAEEEGASGSHQESRCRGLIPEQPGCSEAGARHSRGGVRAGVILPGAGELRNAGKFRGKA